MTFGYFILDGMEPRQVPASQYEEFVAEQGEREWRRIAMTRITDEVHVSTVFLIFDHNFYGGMPILFESMVFGGDFDQRGRRYETWEDAVQGHHEIVGKLLSGEGIE